MRSHAKIQEKAQEICTDLASLMIEVAGSPLEQSDTLDELRATYGHAERVLATLQQDAGLKMHPKEQAAKRLFLPSGLKSDVVHMSK